MGRPPSKNNSLTEKATLVASLAQSGTPGSEMEKMAALLNRKMLKEEAAEEEERTIALAAREAGAKSMQNKRDMELYQQDNCSHTKPLGGPAIGGQRDHKNDYHFMCLFCSKMWLNGELPSHLKISLDRVGGPTA